MMSTATIHTPTSVHIAGRHASDDPRPLIDELRQHARGVEEYQRVAETAQAEAMGLRQRVRDVEAERDDARRLAATYRAQLVQWQLADRLRSIEADLLDENRLLRDQIEDLRSRLGVAPDGPRGRRRRP